MKMSMGKILFVALGILLVSSGYIYYQKQTNTAQEDEPTVYGETYEFQQANATTTPKEPSERALRASVGVFLLVNDEQEQAYLDKFSDDNDIKEAVKNLALALDSDSTKLIEVERIISSVDSSSSYSDYSYDTSDDYSYGNEVSDNSYGSSGGSSYGSNKSLRYNSFSNSWEYAGENESLQYNAFEDEWEYAGDDESTKYNAFENEWEFAGSDESTKYNAFENTWEYAPDDSITKYNSFENKWEITSPDSSLEYNAFENTWSYE